MFKVFTTIALVLGVQFLLTLGVLGKVLDARLFTDPDVQLKDKIAPSFGAASSEKRFKFDIRSEATTAYGLADVHAGEVYIRNLSGEPIQAFVSIYNATGSDAWFDVPTAFVSPAGVWKGRLAWEVVGFRNASDTQRVGFYRDFRGVVTMVTFRSFSDIVFDQFPV